MSRIEISMKHRLVVLSLCYCCMNWSAMANAKNVVPTERKQQVISNVDTSLEGTSEVCASGDRYAVLYDQYTVAAGFAEIF